LVSFVIFVLVSFVIFVFGVICDFRCWVFVNLFYVAHLRSSATFLPVSLCHLGSHATQGLET
jgi:hypothetical protein